ncbi:MAG: enoyl-CoA hydratase/isomerase family protein [Nocardioides sp.]|nr:enoyl-CoA hydratase/isomerase family protein [Nocardioides sp.]
MSIQRERREPGIEILRIDRPERRNALDTATLRLALAALQEISADDSVRAVVFSTTSVTALCAGADVGEPLDAAGGVTRMELFAELYQRLKDVPVPTIAVCVGNAVGAGAELAAGCDLRVAGDNLKLAWAGARLGVPVGPARLTQLVGLGKAKELVYTGRAIGADEALALGLASRRVPAEHAESAAVELAEAIAGQSAPGIRVLKEMFRDLEEVNQRIDYENQRLLDFQRHGAGLSQG